jgi:hypothetical protein
VRDLGGWLAEKAGQLKLLFDDPKHGTLGRLEALEFLELGILGKRGLWRERDSRQERREPRDA